MLFFEPCPIASIVMTDADDDAQHREEGTQFIVGKCPKGYFEKVGSIH